jgi:hypothetical protein
MRCLISRVQSATAEAWGRVGVKGVLWAAAEGVSQDVIAAVLLLHEHSVDDVAPKLSARELEQTVVLVGRSPRFYVPGTLEALEGKRARHSRRRPKPSTRTRSRHVDVIADREIASLPRHTALEVTAICKLTFLMPLGALRGIILWTLPSTLCFGEVVMLPKPELAFFAIADISGYTSFLAGVELDHAQDIIADLMDTVVKGLRPPFRLAKFEGDAAFVYAVAEKIDGSLLQDTIESAYFKFRRRLRDVKQASTCECKACVAMGNLDFKFVVHHGEMVKQKMGGREELAGRDVILVHRLLKNTVSEKVGGRAYALYSDACIQTMGMDPVAQGLVEHRETIDIIGDVRLWLRDLQQAWKKENERTHVEVTRADAYVTWDFDIAAPRQTVWEYFTVPGSGRNGGPLTRSSRPQAKNVGELALSIIACTERTLSSKRCWIGVLPTILP